MALALGRKAKYDTMTEMVATTTSDAIQMAMNMKEVEEDSESEAAEIELRGLKEKETGVMPSETETGEKPEAETGLSGEKEKDKGVMESVATKGELEMEMGVPEKETGEKPESVPAEKVRGEPETEMDDQPRELVTVEAKVVKVDQREGQRRETRRASNDRVSQGRGRE